MKNKQLALRVLSTAAVMSILTSISAPAFADVYDLTRGDLSINVNAKNQQTVTQTDSTGGYVKDDNGDAIKDRVDDDVIVTTKDKDTQEIKTTDNTVTVNAPSSTVSVNVTLRDVSIDASEEGKAALTLSGVNGGSVVLELDGNNTLVSGEGHAGIEKGNVLNQLIIQDEKNDDGSAKTAEKNDTGHLTATGGAGGAGIGGASKGTTTHTRNINITGGDITANGGAGAAGIGGGQRGSMINSADTGVISGGKINATGGEGAAGIGGGKDSYLNTLVITGGADVTATGGKGGAGIGSGEGSWALDVTIQDGSKVNATGNGGGAGIGGGNKSAGFGFVIQGDDTVVNATGNEGGAGIGGGSGGASGSGNPANAGKITDIQGGTVTRTLDETVLPAAGHHWVLNAANDLQECSVCHKTMPVETNSPSLTVTGSALYQMTLENGCYLVTAPAQSASLTGTLAALKELRSQGVQVLVFRTQLCESRVSVAELLAQGTDSSTFVLTHTEGSATLTVDQKDCTSLLG